MMDPSFSIIAKVSMQSRKILTKSKKEKDIFRRKSTTDRDQKRCRLCWCQAPEEHCTSDIVALRTREYTRRNRLHEQHDCMKAVGYALREAYVREALHRRRTQRRRMSYRAASARATRRGLCLSRALSWKLCELEFGMLARNGEADEQVEEARQDEFDSVVRRRKNDDERLALERVEIAHGFDL